jgi:hypothetical protein
MSKMLVAIATFCLVTLSGSTFAQAGSCEQNCAAGCAGKGNFCFTRCSTSCAQTGKGTGKGAY